MEMVTENVDLGAEVICDDVFGIDGEEERGEKE